MLVARLVVDGKARRSDCGSKSVKRKRATGNLGTVKLVSAGGLIPAIPLTLAAMVWASRAMPAEADTRDALALIVEAAQKICNDVPTMGERQSIGVNGDVKAELNGLLKRLGDIGISGSGKYEADKYAGVLQHDLASALKENGECKLTVLRLLIDRVMPQAEAASKSALAQDQVEALRRRLEAITPKPPVSIMCRTPANACEKFAYFLFDLLKKSGWDVDPPITTQQNNLIITGEHGITIISTTFAAEEMANALRSPDAGAYPAVVERTANPNSIRINIGDLP